MKPILFSTPMVQAILDGRKTMTRRVIKPQPGDHQNDDGYLSTIVERAPIKKGDILWVRETWSMMDDTEDHPELEGNPKEKWQTGFVYKTDYTGPVSWNWKPSIFMPREACRIFLEVTDVRVEKLGDISGYDVLAEGVGGKFRSGARCMTSARIDHESWEGTQISLFKSLWRSINGDWNPEQWVWVYSFKRIEKPE